MGKASKQKWALKMEYCLQTDDLVGARRAFGPAFKDASLAGQAMVAIVGLTIVSSGIPEAVLCGIVAPAVCRPVQRILSRQQGVAAVK